MLWALAAGGREALETMLATLAEETAVTIAGLGAASVADLTPGMVRRAWGEDR